MDWYYSAGGDPIGPHSADEIESLFRSGHIAADTLVWRKGLAQWTTLADTEEFAPLLDGALPPPVPPGKQQATAYRANDEVLVAEHVDDDDRVVDGPAPDGAPAFNLTAATLGPTLAGPWERYFARSIDLMIILSVLLTGLYWVLPSISPKLFLDLYRVEPAAMALLLLPLALFINAVIITLCGNSLGRAIFAIKAEPIDGRAGFGFGGNLLREFRVWTQGLALGIPLLNLFTLVPAYRAVSRGKPAAYDIGRATVRIHSRSQLRSTLGILFGMLLYLGIFALNSMERVSQDALALPSSWANPTTLRTTTIPAGWQYEAIPAADGTVHGFTNMITGVVAILGGETVPANLDMAAYTYAISQSLAATTKLGTWTASTMPGIWVASGQFTQGGYPSTAYVGQNGTQFWRIIYVDQLTTTPRQIVEPEMTAALFRSAGIGATQ